MANPKLFVFAIGGTGSRVLRSLTFLLASGADLGGYDLVPIVIDPDDQNGDLNRNLEVLKLYRKIKSDISGYNPEKGDFFQTEILAPDQTKDGLIGGFTDFRFNLDKVNNLLFKDYIGDNSMSDANKALVRLLFSEHDLNSDMNVGFKGRPHMGAVVLNQIPDSDYFRNFAQSIDSHDRIFLISSIFGGTGSAGFPLLVKNIREGSSGSPIYSKLQSTAIGALSVKPYFKLKDGDGNQINSHTFLMKAKAALNYYSKNLINDGSVNVLYSIGDEGGEPYPNEVGGKNQKNRGHFVELAGALAILDFANLSESDSCIRTQKGKATNPEVREFGTKEVGTNGINLLTLTDKSKARFSNHLVRYFLLNYFMDLHLSNSFSRTYAKTKNVSIDSTYLSSSFFTDFSAFNVQFKEWLGELKTNNVSFAPFSITFENNVFRYVNKDLKNIAGKDGAGLKKQDKLKGFEVVLLDFLADAHKRNSELVNPNHYFIEVFNYAFNKLSKKYPELYN
jgi:hypothetical protein